MLGNQWCPCKSDTCSLGKGVKEIIREAGPILAATLGTVSFINQDQHLFPVADHTKGLMANNLGLIIGTDLFDLVLVAIWKPLRLVAIVLKNSWCRGC